MLDPLSIATSFSTIVGLLSNFKSERSGGQLSEFITWLKEKHHEDVVSGIEQNQMLSRQLQSLLVLNHHDLVTRLDSLDMILASIATNIDTFSSLATTIRPDSIFSEQAISIVKQFVVSGASEIWESSELGTREPAFIFLGGSGRVNINEPRFVEDDLKTLVEFGILRLDYGSKGTRKFIITRKAVQLVA
ncbi:MULTISPECIES: hypothetical protein [Shewanella]|uniref:Uncharacterized protein n=2 Tax=Shewanella TaxID=22 RepID=A0A9X2WUN7_9GAMM|nr:MULTISPECIES: hypothetical protein [Shewanella]MCT7945417.1 hypothetical protein [Shewanella septentrionalis]MCU8004135.1 hypothetical protein [Shewanella sp. SM96]SUI78387.1 Uncharacterised protein [Shewanella baltica]